MYIPFPLFLGHNLYNTYMLKEMQRALIQYKKPENYDLVKEALLANNRNDLIGFGPKCLIPPRKIRSRSNEKSRKR